MGSEPIQFVDDNSPYDAAGDIGDATTTTASSGVGLYRAPHGKRQRPPVFHCGWSATVRRCGLVCCPISWMTPYGRTTARWPSSDVILFGIAKTCEAD